MTVSLLPSLLRQGGLKGSVLNDYRSGCPVSLGLDVFGDKWTLLIVRDLTFNGKRHFGELLMSDERISTSILANRLKMLTNEGILTRTDNPNHKQKRVYSLTEKGIDLLPILMQVCIWSYKYKPVGETYVAPVEAYELASLDPAEQRRLKAALREVHLGSAEAA